MRACSTFLIVAFSLFALAHAHVLNPKNLRSTSFCILWHVTCCLVTLAAWYHHGLRALPPRNGPQGEEGMNQQRQRTAGKRERFQHAGTPSSRYDDDTTL